MSKPYLHPTTGFRSYVKFHPRDLGIGLPKQYLQDPATFVPVLHPELHQFVQWGILSAEDLLNPTSTSNPFTGVGGGGGAGLELYPVQKRMMMVQGMYGFGREEEERPEMQFVHALMKKKEKAIASRDPDVRSDRVQRDYILRIHMPLIVDDHGVNYIWRKIKVSGGMPLEVLVDKVLQPVMGWERNLHAWLITDYSDGAQFGLHSSSHLDSAHMYMRGFDALDSSKFTLADVLLNEGESMMFDYDVGDLWWHDIKLEKMVSREESNGRVELIDGSGACPPENCRGNLLWNEKTHERRTLDFHLDAASQPNYSSARSLKRLGIQWRFDPNRFSLPKARQRLSDAISSRASLPFGAKRFLQTSMGGYSFAARLQALHFTAL